MTTDNADLLELLWIGFGLLALVAGVTLTRYAIRQEQERRRRGQNGYLQLVAIRNLRHGIERVVKALAVIVSGVVAALWAPSPPDAPWSWPGAVIKLCVIALGGGLALSSALDLLDHWRPRRHRKG